MARKDTKHYSLDELKAKHHSGDYVPTPPDAPEIEVDEEFWRTARVVMLGETGKTSDTDGNYGRRMMDVFISYSRDDEDVARDIEKRLKERGLEPFLDHKMPGGADFRHELNDNLRCCKEVFALISHNSLKSEWVLVEYGAALALGKLVVPVLIGCTADSLPAVLQDLHAKKYSEIDEVIEACKSNKLTVPDITGEWKYAYRINDDHRYEGTCAIEKDKRDRFRVQGTRKRETREGLCKPVKKPWNTEWAELLPDQKSSDKRLTSEYKLGGVDHGIMSLRIPPQGPVNKFGGEVFTTEGPKDGPVHGTIEFTKRANSRPRRS